MGQRNSLWLWARGLVDSIQWIDWLFRKYIPANTNGMIKQRKQKDFSGILPSGEAMLTMRVTTEERPMYYCLRCSYKGHVDDHGFDSYKGPTQARVFARSWGLKPHFHSIMQSRIYLFLSALLCSSAHGCLSGHHTRNEVDGSHIERQLKLLRARSRTTPSMPPINKTAITNVRVFDGWGFGEPSTVVIHGDSITFDTRHVQHTIDGEGGFLLPGLIDSHIHLGRLDSLETLTSYGVTSVMNMGCSNYTLCAAFREQVGLTSFFTAGEGAVAPNSTHAKVFGATGFVYSPSQAPGFVANVFGNGSDYMKLIAEGDGFKQATHDALVRATHALGKVSMTHCQDFASYEVAIRSKTNGLQHVPFDIPISDDMVQRIKRQGQYVTPTLNIGKIVSENSTIESIVSPGVSLTYEAGVISVQRLMRAGVTILAGTDANDEAGDFLEGDLIGITLHKELQYLTEAGMSEVEVLRAATVVPSITHNLTSRGSIREGYRADLLLLKPGSNPLRNISATMDIARVWVGGFEHVPKARMK